jgi:aspartate/glutamate racemase
MRMQVLGRRPTWNRVPGASSQPWSRHQAMNDPAIVQDRLAQHFGVQTLVPDLAGRSSVHRVIYEELCRGHTDAGSRAAIVQQINALQAAAAQAIILGCTEIGLLIDQSHSPLPVFDTTTLHAAAAVDRICT